MTTPRAVGRLGQLGRVEPLERVGGPLGCAAGRASMTWARSATSSAWPATSSPTCAAVAWDSGTILGTDVIPTVRDILADTLDRIRDEVFDIHRDEPRADPPPPAEPPLSGGAVRPPRSRRPPRHRRRMKSLR